MEYPLLAVETTGAFASAVLKNEDGEIFAESFEEKLNHLKGLLPLVQKVLKAAGREIGEVRTIAVSHGPGSFTGIRIGISTVRAVAQVTGAKVIGVPTLETFVYNDSGYDGIVCPVFDARMDQMYAGAFIKDAGRIETLIPSGAYSPAAFLKGLAKLAAGHSEYPKKPGGPLEVMFFGDGLQVFEPDIIHGVNTIKSEYPDRISVRFAKDSRTQTAGSVLRWAESFGSPIEYNGLYPVYVRKAEAQRRLDEKNACK